MGGFENSIPESKKEETPIEVPANKDTEVCRMETTGSLHTLKCDLTNGAERTIFLNSKEGTFGATLSFPSSPFTHKKKKPIENLPDNSSSKSE